MKKDRIYIDDWMELKPYSNETNIDLYYLNLCNSIYTNLNDISKIILLNYLDQEEIKKLVCFLVSYFEDVISEVGLWQTFQKQYKDQHHKILPFHKIKEEDYIDDEINTVDVYFLIWYYINSIQRDHFISPFNDFILNMCLTVMEVFDEEYEYAPENEKLKSCYTLKETKDFYEIREFMQSIFYGSYIFYPDVQQRLTEEIAYVLEDQQDTDEYLQLSYIREVKENYTFNKKSALLTMNASEWTYHFLKNTKQHTHDLLTISKRISGFFQYKSQDENYVQLAHVASGKPFDLYKESFDHYEELKENDILYIGLVRWNNNWWFSGTYYSKDFDADLILDQKNSIKARSAVNFLNPIEKVNAVLKAQKEAFLKFNEGELTVNLSPSEINDFVEAYMKFYSDGLELSEEEKQASYQRARKDGLRKEKNFEEEIFFGDEDETATIFFNPKKGIEIVRQVDHLFPNKSDLQAENVHGDDIILLLYSPEYAPELVHYFLEKNKSKIPLLRQSPIKEYIEELDFLLQFGKYDSYAEESNITLFG